MKGEAFTYRCTDSTDLWIDIDSRLGEIFTMILDKAFAALAVKIVADLLQLSPVIEKLIL